LPNCYTNRAYSVIPDFSPWWLSIIVFLSLPVSGLIAWLYYLEFNRITGGSGSGLFKSNNQEYLTLKKNHDELINLVASL